MLQLKCYLLLPVVGLSKKVAHCWVTVITTEKHEGNCTRNQMDWVLYLSGGQSLYENVVSFRNLAWALLSWQMQQATVHAERICLLFEQNLKGIWIANWNEKNKESWCGRKVLMCCSASASCRERAIWEDHDFMDILCGILVECGVYMSRSPVNKLEALSIQKHFGPQSPSGLHRACIYRQPRRLHWGPRQTSQPPKNTPKT